MNLNKIVLGTSAIGGVWGTVDPQESVGTILHALESGITLIRHRHMVHTFISLFLS